LVRVLNIIGSLGVGGAERYLSRVTPALKAHGVEVEICCLERSGPLLEIVEAAGVTVHGTRFIFRQRSGSLLRTAPALMRAVEDIRRLIRSRRYDVVHTYLFLADLVGTAAAQLAGSKRIITSRRALHAWRHEPTVLQHWMELGTNVVADELIANSRTVLEDVERYERFLPRGRGVIYNGIDPELYRAASPGKRSGPLRLVNVGALAPRKGQRYAIEALAICAEAGVDARLVLVGAGPDRPLLESAARDSGVEDRVEFAGEQMDPRPFLEAADLFAFPSRQEGFSNALIEAMSSGLPVVATDVGGNAEALGKNGGRIVPPEDSEAFARAVIELAANRRGLAEIGAANRDRVARTFSLEASVKRLADWYRLGPRMDGPHE
jgi:glycosyltransferase involved in cell wall biosynthesis